MRRTTVDNLSLMSVRALLNTVSARLQKGAFASTSLLWITPAYACRCARTNAPAMSHIEIALSVRPNTGTPQPGAGRCPSHRFPNVTLR